MGNFQKLIRTLAVQSAVFKIIVIHIPQSDTRAQVVCGYKGGLVIELLLVFSMASLYRTVLRRFARID